MSSKFPEEALSLRSWVSGTEAPGHSQHRTEACRGEVPSAAVTEPQQLQYLDQGRLCMDMCTAASL